MAIIDKTCLLSRQYTDARRVDFAVIVGLDQVVDLLLIDGCHKVGIAADVLLDRLEKEGLLTRIKVIDHV